ncbi:hypothetical protein [Chitinophaga sp. HK235]|uniref:HU domain-containing protein n=1 Tax=Chitinophaga sp. HK235 TaxID=2952571 RepID=UPI001BA9A612|nr:hypothetical protein [Chitinophaga sp. HK235]
MLVLQQYIQEVLFRQRVCVVPHVGTFSIQHFPARYDAATQTLLPPRDQVIFSQSWQDDGSCLEWIALKENLVPSVAQRKLEKYLEEFKAALESGKTLELPGIGRLQGDFTGNLHFYAEELPVNPADLPIAPIQREEPPAPAALPAIQPTMAVTPVTPPKPPEPVEPLMTAAEEDTLEAVTEGGIFKWWWAVAGAVILLGGLGAWWYIGRQSVHEVPPPAPARPPADTVVDTTQQAPSETVTTAVPAAPDSISYFVILEEYKDSLTAAHKVAKRKSWEQNVVLYHKDNLYKVAVPVKSLPIDTTSVLQEKQSEFKIHKAYLEF